MKKIINKSFDKIEKIVEKEGFNILGVKNFKKECIFYLKEIKK